MQKRSKKYAKKMQKICKNDPTTIQKRTCRDGRFKDRFRTYYYFRSKIWLSLNVIGNMQCCGQIL